MQTFKKLVIFFFCNITGFFLPLILYVLSLKFGIIDINAEGFDVENFFVGVTEVPNFGPIPAPGMIYFAHLTWALCALFSIAYFFVAKRWKRIFVLAPLLLPLLHSLIILLRFI